MESKRNDVTTAQAFRGFCTGLLIAFGLVAGMFAIVFGQLSLETAAEPAAPVEHEIERDADGLTARDRVMAQWRTEKTVGVTKDRAWAARDARYRARILQAQQARLLELGREMQDMARYPWKASEARIKHLYEQAVHASERTVEIVDGTDYEAYERLLPGAGAAARAANDRIKAEALRNIAKFRAAIEKIDAPRRRRAAQIKRWEERTGNTYGNRYHRDPLG